MMLENHFFINQDCRKKLNNIDRIIDTHLSNVTDLQTEIETIEKKIIKLYKLRKTIYQKMFDSFQV